MRRQPDPQLWSELDGTRPPVAKIGDLAAEAGLRRIHVLAWRDLADVEAGGSELHASIVARLWSEAGVSVTMRTSYSQGAPPESVRDGYRVIRRAGRYLVFPRAVLAELSGRHGRRDGLVEIWNGVPFFAPVWARGPRVTFLHHVHTEMWPLVMPAALARAGQILERDLAPRVYRRTPIITLSESSKTALVTEMGLPARHVHVVPPGVDPSFCPGGRRSHEPLLVAVGRLMPSKRFDKLIEMVASARDRLPVRLVIAGEGYEQERLERLVRDLDAESWCELRGFVPTGELIELYRSAWAVVSASLSEGWGMTLTEAAACGTPSIATRIAGHADAVVDEHTGLLIDDEPGFVRALTRLVDDDSLRTRLGADARRRVERLTWERTAHDTLAVLAAAASHRPGR